MRLRTFKKILIVTASWSVMKSAALAQEEATALQRITIDKEAAAGKTDRYVAKSAASTAKAVTPIVETPQSVAVITRKQLDDQNPQTVGSALRYSAGVLSERDATSRYDSVFLRGFGSFGTTTNFVGYLDGLKLPRGQAFAVTSIDPFLLDHIDVLKGPSALLYGQISPGGIVNQVSRETSATAKGEARLEVGSHGRVQGGITSTGPIDAEGVWQYGITAVGRTAGTQYDDVDERRGAIAPAITFQPDEDTRLTVSGFYQRDPEGGYFNSLYPKSLAPEQFRGALNSELNIGDPEFDAFEREQKAIGYDFEHRFSDLLTVRSKARYGTVDIDFQSLQMSGPLSATGEIPRWALRSVEEAKGFATDNQAEFTFDTGSVAHTLLAGIDYQHTESDWQYMLGAATSLNVLNPQYGQPAGPLATLIDSGQTLKQTGVYLQDQLAFGGFRAVLGIRHDWTEQSADNNLTGVGQSQSSNDTSYRAGLLYLFDNGLAPYASYATSFEPVIGVDADGNAFSPTEARQYEVGLKYQPAGWDALFTVSAFDITQKNVLTPGAMPGFNVQQGEVSSRGIELEARGTVADNLELIAALTWLDTEVSKSNTPGVEGNRPQAVPTYFGSIWANYTVDTGALDGLTLGAGLRWVGSSYADDANSIKTPGYAVVDAAAQLDLGKLSPSLQGARATLNVTNLFDREYYTSCSSNIYCQFGNRRLVVAGLRYAW